MGKTSEAFVERDSGGAARGWATRLERAPLESAAAPSRVRTSVSSVLSPDSSPGSPVETRAPAVMRGRCAFNQIQGSARRCRGSSRAGGMCEGCERVRDRWTARLMTEFQVGMSRSQIHMLLNRFMDLNKSREHLRNLQESRSPKASQVDPNSAGQSKPAEPAECAPAAKPAADTPASCGAKPDTLRQEAGTVRVGDALLPKQTIASSPVPGMCTPEAKNMAHRLSPKPQKKSPVHDLLTLFSASAHVGSAVAEAEVADDSTHSIQGKAPLPQGLCLCGISGGGMKEMWVKERVSCWVCGSETLADSAAVAAMVIGGISVESRSKSVGRYGGLPCVPVLTCGCKGCDGVGRSQALSAVWWCSQWVPVPEFLVIPGGDDDYIEAAEGPCRERVILQVCVSAFHGVRGGGHVQFCV